MKPLKAIFRAVVIIASSCSRLLAQSAATADTADDLQVMLEAIESTTPNPASTSPEFGTFYSAQFGEDSPPYPGNVLELPFWSLGDGFYLLDDRAVDYAAIREEAEAEALLTEFSGNRFSMLASSVSYAYGNPVYLTNLFATWTTLNRWASFDIAGGTNNVPYDILMTTNIAVPIVQWNWLGIGYTSNHYAFSNQPADQAFYILAKPQKTMVVGLGTNAFDECNVWLGLSNAVSVAAGFYHSLALLNDGTVSGWGNNSFGQITVPTNVLSASMVAAGWYHSVALLTNGTVIAWGYNGAIFDWHLTEVPADLTNATVISAQALHSIALRKDGTVVGWGYGPDGETNSPVGLSNVVAIAAGYQHNLAAKSDGTVFSWGDNSYGQRDVPAGLSNVVDVAAGLAHSVALRSDGTVIAWGDNSYGETNVPSGLTNVVAIAAGGSPGTGSSYSLALRSDGTVVKWGSGEVLDPVDGLTNVISMAAGVHHALAVRTGPATPVITLEPTDQYQVIGGSVTFTARGAGLYGVLYQWQTNGVNLAGQTNATLILTNVQAVQAVTYDVVVSNEIGNITSSNAALSIVTAPVIVSQTPLPTNQVVFFQSELYLSVAATAPRELNGFPLTYQWQHAGTNLPGATATNYTVVGTTISPGIYSVIVSNAAGAVSASWQVTLDYLDTLAYYLATNAVGYASGYSGSVADQTMLDNWTYGFYTGTNMGLLTNAIWSTNFWLHGVQGLSATSIGISNNINGGDQYYGTALMITMVSPRHYLRANHIEAPNGPIAFLDTNNVIYWRTFVQQLRIGTSDTDVGILNADLPASVGYLQVVPTNLLNYLPTNSTSYVQGIGMNQHARLFSQPMRFDDPLNITWNRGVPVPFGLATNWNVLLVSGDSSDPERFLIGNQFVLTSHNWESGDGPNYAFQIEAINQQMHYLSTNNSLATDYQLTQFPLTNWPAIH